MSGTVLRARKRVFLSKIESTQGTDASPVVGSDAIRAYNTIANIQTDAINRPSDNAYMGSRKDVHTNKRIAFSGGVELAGSGTAGTPPPIDSLLRSMAMSVTNVVSTSDTYAPVSESFESVTQHLNIDGVLWEGLGVMGTGTINAQVGDFPKLDFSYMGEYSAVTDSAIADGDVSGFQDPVAIEEATCAFTAGGVSLDLRAFTLDLGVTVNPIESTETRCMMVADRQPTGSLKIWMPLLATYNAFTHALTHLDEALVVTLGTTAGKIVTINVPTSRFGVPQQGDDNGVAVLDIPFKPIPSSGDDEFSIVFT